MQPIVTLHASHVADLGDGFTVFRSVPQAAVRSVGPFVFVDHFGPHDFPAGAGLDVRPHPHIGLATVTWLFDGEILHRDSLGTLQAIAPGDVNWMVARRGIVHSERTAPARRTQTHRLHGVQTWLALPTEHEDCAPAFAHHPAATLPLIEREGVRLRVIAGQAFGGRSPVAVFSPTLYCALELAAGARFVVTTEHAERAVYVVSGEVAIDGQHAARGQLAVLATGLDVTLTAQSAVQLMLLGGAPLGPRHVWWNLVSTSREKIVAAQDAWRHYAPGSGTDRFPAVPDEREFIPLPDR